jgi:hypothetical protein
VLRILVLQQRDVRLSRINPSRNVKPSRSPRRRAPRACHALKPGLSEAPCSRPAPRHTARRGVNRRGAHVAVVFGLGDEPLHERASVRHYATVSGQSMLRFSNPLALAFMAVDNSARPLSTPQQCWLQPQLAAVDATMAAATTADSSGGSPMCDVSAYSRSFAPCLAKAVGMAW